MYPVERLTQEQREIYHTIRDRIDPTYSIDILLSRFDKGDLEDFLSQSERLPRDLINQDRGFARRLARIATALARKGGFRKIPKKAMQED